MLLANRNERIAAFFATAGLSPIQWPNCSRLPCQKDEPVDDISLLVAQSDRGDDTVHLHNLLAQEAEQDCENAA
jgi:hypothetical protein